MISKKQPTVLLGYLFAIFIANNTVGAEYRLDPGSVTTRLPAIIGELQDGDSIYLPEGTFQIDQSLSISARQISLKGAGKEKTVLDFRTQLAGAQAMLVRGWDVSLQGFSIKHPLGDGLVVRNSARVRLVDISIDMSRPQNQSPGAYGIYPVTSQHIYMAGLEVTGASDAGIYLGQSKFAEVRDSRATGNVAGITIENSVSVKVENNLFSNNAIGAFITSLPDMIYSSSEGILFTNNTVIDNNGPNFSDEGALVNTLGSGKGIILIAVKNFSLEENLIGNNNHQDLIVANYKYLRRPPHPGTFDISIANVKLVNNTLRSSLLTDQQSIDKIKSCGEEDVGYTLGIGFDTTYISDSCNEPPSIQIKVQPPKAPINAN